MYNQIGDETVVPLFRAMSRENKALSDKEGRPIFEDVEVVDIRFAGSRNYGTYPVNQLSHWMNDPYTGEQRPITYAERFRRQYAQFLEHKQQTKSGTPLEFAGFLTEARRSELKAQNVYTIETLAAIEGAELKNLGPGGRDMKNQAVDFIAKGRANVPNIEMQAELDAMRARLAVFEEDKAASKNIKQAREAKFDAMSLDQLREFIEANSGHKPTGLLNKQRLIALAMEVPEARAS
jgi:hypothetical protein